jgi:hypothetical protein
MDRFFIHPVTFTRPATVTGRYGDTVTDWSAPPLATFNEHGWMTRTGTEEMAEGREAITDTWELSLPPSTALDETMRVSHAGTVYEVRGSIQRAGTPGGSHHVVAQLREVRG